MSTPKSSRMRAPSYQALSNQLDEVVAKLQDPEVNIDDAVKYYETALGLIEKLEAYLEAAENRVRELKLAMPSEKNK